MPQPIRTFIAVELPLEVKEHAAKLVKQLQKAEADVKWVRPEHMHWTLSFLGNVDLLEIPAVCDAVIEAARPLAPFELVARGAGAFPNAREPRTIWLGTGEGTEAMCELYGAIARNLDQLGYRPDARNYRPHVTLGRLRERGRGTQELSRLLIQLADYDAGVALVDEVVVMSSTLGRDGPTYEPLGHAELGGGG